MSIIIRNGEVFITIREVVNYLNGMKQDLDNLKESNILEVTKRIEDPGLQKIILKIDDDNFKLFTGKLDATIEDLGRHLTHSMIKATKEIEQRKKTNKCECSHCHKKYKSKSSLIDLISLDGLYKKYCDTCFKKQLKEYIDKGVVTFKREVKLDRLGHKYLLEMSRLCDVAIQNYICSHPELLKKAMASEPMKELQKRAGLVKDG